MFEVGDRVKLKPYNPESHLLVSGFVPSMKAFTGDGILYTIVNIEENYKNFGEVAYRFRGNEWWWYENFIMEEKTLLPEELFII